MAIPAATIITITTSDGLRAGVVDGRRAFALALGGVAETLHAAALFACEAGSRPRGDDVPAALGAPREPAEHVAS